MKNEETNECETNEHGNSYYPRKDKTWPWGYHIEKSQKHIKAGLYVCETEGMGNKTIAELEKEMINLPPMSACEFAGYDHNGDEVYAPSKNNK